MNVVDSSGWIEYFEGHGNAKFFAEPIRDLDELLVPSIAIFEVYRRMLRQRGAEDAGEAVAHMRLGMVVDLDQRLATSAATIAHEEKLAMADAIILATAWDHEATLWTQDADLKRFPGVKFRAK